MLKNEEVRSTVVKLFKKKHCLLKDISTKTSQIACMSRPDIRGKKIEDLNVFLVVRTYRINRCLMPFKYKKPLATSIPDLEKIFQINQIKSYREKEQKLKS